MTVDVEPPRLSGALYVSNKSVNVAAKSGSSGVSVARYLILLFNASEPVQPLELTSVLELGGGAKLVSAKCFQDPGAAQDVVTAASATLVATGNSSASAGPPGSAYPPPPAVSSSQASQASVLNVTGGRPYVQSCVAVMWAEEGTRPSIRVPEGAVADLTGNTNIK